MLNLSSRTSRLVALLVLAGATFLPGGTAVVAGIHSSSDKPATKEAQIVAAETDLTIVDIATAAGSFKTLTAALEAADLVDVLNGSGPFTVFAPTDEAFAKLPKGTVENLLKPENKDKLVKILTYHVVAGNVLSTDLKSGKVATVEGSEVTIEVGKPVKVDNAQVLKADIKASNGVIHVIDQVILPTN